MQQHRRVRVIKHQQRAGTESLTKAQCNSGTEPSERELKTVVSGWISEHRQRSEEYRRALTDLLKESGFRSPRATSLA
ncbi:MAG: hypothetical protein QOH25_2036 [Acidobacteriota bacterium]|jgi:hypothetical protein|nr:hypothetical protein [Acidobacteriota bacterium]